MEWTNNGTVSYWNGAINKAMKVDSGNISLSGEFKLLTSNSQTISFYSKVYEGRNSLKSNGGTDGSFIFAYDKVVNGGVYGTTHYIATMIGNEETLLIENDNKFHHFAFSWDKDNNLLEIYVDGSNVVKKVTSPKNLGTDLVIEGNSNLYDHLRLFNKALDSVHIDILAKEKDQTECFPRQSVRYVECDVFRDGSCKEYWKFDGNTNTSDNCGHNFLVDSDGSDLTYVDGVCEQAIQTDDIQSTNTEIINTLDSSHNIGTMTCYLKFIDVPPNNNDSGIYLTIGSSSNNGNAVLGLYNENGNQKLVHFLNNNINVICDATIDSFFHLAITQDRDNNKIRYYVDGEFKAEFDMVINSSGNVVRIGDYYNHRQIVCDNMRFFDKILTDEEISQLALECGNG